MPRKETHNAIVTRNIEADEATTLLLRGAVYFNSPTLFEGEYPLPAFPCFPFASAPNGAGFFFVPKVGDEIEVEVFVDDPNNPDDTTDAELPEPRWVCMIYSDAADIAEEFKVNYPFRMGWKTNSGHILLFDDKEGKELVKMAHKIGTFFEWTKDGDWLEKIVRNKVIDIVKNLTVTIGGDETETVEGKSVKTVTGLFTVTADGAITLNTKAAMNLLSDAAAKLAGKAGTNIGDASSPTVVDGAIFQVNAPISQIGGATPVARLGDQAVGTGNAGAPVMSTIIQGSPTVGVG